MRREDPLLLPVKRAITSRSAGFFVRLFLVLGLSVVALHSPTQAATNLIPNPDLEVEINSLPADWIRGRWGQNTANFIYPVPGYNSNRAARVDLTARSSGDAKWTFKPVGVSPGRTYQFKNFYQATVPTFVTVEYYHSDGRKSYGDLAFTPASNNWREQLITFTIPAGVNALSIFHLINQVGSLTVDRYDLTALPPNTGNLIVNPSLELTDAAGFPQSWQRGGWGNHQRSFRYPVAGSEGARAARVEITNYVNGDAKWYFAEVPARGGQAFRLRHDYRSSRESFVTARFTFNDGSVHYLDLTSLPAVSTWQPNTLTLVTPAGATSFTIFHLLKGNGWLEVDNYALTHLNQDPTKFDRGYVSIHFDDGVLDAYQNAFPILDSAGFKADTFITTERLSSHFPGYVKSDDVLIMQAAGHLIGAHTRTHPPLTTLPPAEAAAEISGSREDLLHLGASPIDYFAYPYGDYNEAVKTLVKNAGFIAARSSDGGYNQKNTDRYALRRQPMINTTTFAQAKSYIDTALRDKTWVILLFHEVNNSGRPYSVTPVLFQQIVDYLVAQKITPITMAQGVALMNP